jgi:hypothetical protein
MLPGKSQLGKMFNKTTFDNKVSTTVKFLLFFTVSLVFVIASRNNFFFWDTITQVSVPANWYFDTSFRYFFVPNETGTDHPTITGMYLAAVWKLFGRSLLVSHLAFLPFISGILFQLFRYIERSGESKYVIWLIFLVVLCDPTLVSQMSLLTFDIIQIFAFLWCINSVTDKKVKQLAVAFALLCLTSLRGMICGGGIIIFYLIAEYKNYKKLTHKMLIPFLPGIIILVLFYVGFYLNKQSFTYSTGINKWEQFSQFASPLEMLRNIGIFGWRLIDFGRIGIWIVFAFLIIKLVLKRTKADKFMENTLLVILTQFIVFFPACIIYRNPFGHRYLLPIIIPVAIITTYWILNHAKRRLIYVTVFAILISGWFWIYPVRISQGWDSTPAHWPYYELRTKMLKFMESEKIPVLTTGSFFPNTASLRLIDLSRSNAAFKEADLASDNYILFSNIYNLKDPVIDDLFLNNNWIPIKSISKRNVSLILFKSSIIHQKP